MSQRMDDVTGEPIRLSATQRERQREEIVTAVQALIKNQNDLMPAVRELQALFRAQEARITGLDAMLLMCLDRLESRPWWRRMSWR